MNFASLGPQINEMMASMPSLVAEFSGNGPLNASKILQGFSSGDLMTKIMNMTSQMASGNMTMSDVVRKTVTEIASEASVPCVRSLVVDKVWTLKQPRNVSFEEEELFTFTFNDKKYKLPKGIGEVLPIFSIMSEGDMFCEVLETPSNPNATLFELKYEIPNKQILNGLWQMALGADEVCVVKHILSFETLLKTAKLMQYLSFDLKAIKNVCLSYLKTKTVSDFYEAYSKPDDQDIWPVVMAQFPSTIYQTFFNNKDFDVFEDTKKSRTVLENIITRFIEPEDFQVVENEREEQKEKNKKGLIKVLSFFGSNVPTAFVKDGSLYFGMRRYTLHNPKCFMWTLVTALVDEMVGGDKSDGEWISLEELIENYGDGSVEKKCRRSQTSHGLLEEARLLMQGTQSCEGAICEEGEELQCKMHVNEETLVFPSLQELSDKMQEIKQQSESHNNRLERVRHDLELLNKNGRITGGALVLPSENRISSLEELGERLASEFPPTQIRHQLENELVLGFGSPCTFPSSINWEGEPTLRIRRENVGELDELVSESNECDNDE